MQAPRAARVAALFAVLAPVAAFAGTAEQHTGRVTHVVNGHAVEMLVNAKRVRVRLAGIDAPQEGQAYGLRSRQALVRLCAGEIATVEATGRTDGGWLVGRVVCAGTDAGSEQVRLGMARISEPAGAGLQAIEREARSAHRGLWSTQTTVMQKKP